jgi:hypothetical protein
MPLEPCADVFITIFLAAASLGGRSIAFGSIIGDDWAMRADLPCPPFPNHGA